MGEDWKVIMGDCLDVIPTLEPGSVRLVFADPPYNQGVDYGPHHDAEMTPGAYLAWCDAWLGAAARSLTPDGSLWLLVSHEWTWQLVPIALKAGLHLCQWVTWYETFGVNCTRKFNRCSRPLLWFVKNPKRFVFNHECPEVRRKSKRQELGDKRAGVNGKLWDDVWIVSRVCGTFNERNASAEFSNHQTPEFWRSIGPVDCEDGSFG